MPSVTETVANHPVVVGISAANSTVNDLHGAPMWALSDDDVEAAVSACAELATRQFELQLRLVREADGRDLGRRMGASSTAAWLRHRFRMRPATAKHLVELANRTRPSEPVNDWNSNVSPTESKTAMPATGQAIAAGEISADHAQVISSVMSRLPDHVTCEQAAKAEADLAGWAKIHDPLVVSKLGDYLLHVLDADTLADGEDDDVTRRELRIHTRTGRGTFRLDKEGLELLRAALDPLAAPCPANDGTPDLRTEARRMADALVELARRACDSGDLPGSRGTRPHLTLISGLETLLAHHNSATAEQDAEDHGSASNQDSSGDPTDNGNSAASPSPDPMPPSPAPPNAGFSPGEFAWGGPVSAEAVRRIACDAGVSRVLVDANSVPLDVGREHRIVTPGQFTALVARDGGCAFAGCTRPPSWCEGHHIRHWADGGVTALHNLVLLCTHHHRVVHHDGWDVRLDVNGIPEFIPPAWVDPAQEPRTNDRPRHYKRKP